MIAHIVPITRIRHSSSWWSYTIPKGVKVIPGCIVEVDFNHRTLPGVVWEVVESDPKASQPIHGVLCLAEIVRGHQRELIEWIARSGCISLSSALFLWLPRALRVKKYPKSTLATLNRLPIEADLKPQQLYLVPEKRPRLQAFLTQREPNHFWCVFDQANIATELNLWFKVWSGQTTTILGRERALFAPFRNLSQITVLNPEDISYLPGQLPFVHMVETATELGRLYQAKLQLRSFLSKSVAKSIWPQADGLTEQNCPIELTDLNKQPIISQPLINQIQTVLSQSKSVFIYQNAHDRITLMSDGSGLQQTGVETYSNQIKANLTPKSIGKNLQFGTRKALTELDPQPDLTVILDLGPELRQSSFADQIQNYANLNRIISISKQVIIQTKQPQNSLTQALLQHRLSQVLEESLKVRQANHLPPYATIYQCLNPDQALTLKLYHKLAQIIETHPTSWKVSYPETTTFEQKAVSSLNLYHPETTGVLLPMQIQQILTNLSHPWKIIRNPWYYM